MNKRSKNLKVLALLTAVCLLAGMGLALLHHHADGSDSFDCGVCQLVRQIVLVFVLAFISIFEALKKRSEAFAVSDFVPNSRVFVSTLKGRAPPFSF